MNNGARLPFPRGQTASNNISVANPTGGAPISLLAGMGLLNNTTPATTPPYRPDLGGIGILETSDTILATKRDMKLRCVQNGTGKAILPGPYAVQFQMTNGCFGKVIATAGVAYAGSGIGALNTAGLVSKPIDPAHFYFNGAVIVNPTPIQPNDWFFVVEEGPALVAGAASVAPGASVEADANGRAIAAIAAKSAMGTVESPTMIAAVNASQLLNFVDNTSVGTFTLTVEGITTAAITYNSTFATLAAAITGALNTALGGTATTSSGTLITALTIVFGGVGYSGRPVGAITANLAGMSTPLTSLTITTSVTGVYNASTIYVNAGLAMPEA